MVMIRPNHSTAVIHESNRGEGSKVLEGEVLTVLHSCRVEVGR